MSEHASYHIKFFLSLIILIGTNFLLAQTDTLKKIKSPKHYFATTVFADFYATPQKDLSQNLFRKKELTTTDKKISAQLKTYRYEQSVGGFYFPISTTEKVHADGTVSNFHFLGTGSYMLAMPRFGGISDHNLVKASLGLRGIYNTGRKGIWFFDAAPFVSADLSVSGTSTYRWSSTVLYDRIVSPKFSFRLGYTRTYILGNRKTLPYIGLRFGRLDKRYVSIQFPRNITFSFPMGLKVRGSIVGKPMGGVFNIGNTDSIYNGNDKAILFGRTEFITGFRVDASINRNFSFFASLGFTGISTIAFFSPHYNKGNLGSFGNFFLQQMSGGGYLNMGITLRFGKTKSIYNNSNMYEVFNLNSTIDVGDNNTNTGDANIPNSSKQKALSELKTKDVQDLIEAQDLY